MRASGGYPGAFEKGKAIHGIEDAEATGASVFQAGNADGLERLGNGRQTRFRRDGFCGRLPSNRPAVSNLPSLPVGSSSARIDAIELS